MQWLAALCIRRPVFTWVLVVSLVVIGIASMLGLGVDRYPNVDLPIVVVTTVLPGASPDQIESEVSDPLEEAINTTSGLDELRSVSYEGLSVVTATFTLDVDATTAATDVRDRVNRAFPNLPKDVEQPVVQRLDPSAVPVMLVAVLGKGSVRDTTEVATRRVRRQLEAVGGVGTTAILGGRARQITLEADPDRLEKYGLTISDIERAVTAEDVNVPGGYVMRGAEARQLRIEGRIDSAAGFNDMAVAARGGGIVRLKDVGQAKDTQADPASLASLSGRDVVVLQIIKQSGANTVAVVDALRARVREIESSLPLGFELRIVRDESEFIRNAISAVEQHLVVGATLAALVVLLFLWNVRATAIAALAIPSSIVSSFALVRAMGLTLNTLTLLALTLSVGIVIDDAIVVLENIYRFLREKHMPPRDAAIFATREIGLAVLATTLSLIAVFLPIGFMGGIVGRFMKSFGLTMSFSIAVSLFVAFSLTPMLSARWLRPPKEGVPPESPLPPPETKDERAIYDAWRRGDRTPPLSRGGLHGSLERRYVKLLAFLMPRRWIVGLSILAAIASAIPLGIIVDKNFLPLDDESRFEVTIRAEEGTSLDQTRLLCDRIAADIRALSGVRHTVVTIGSEPGDPSGRSPNEASIFVALVDPRDRPLDQYAMMNRVRRDVLPKYAAFKLRTIVTPVNVFGGTGAQSAGIQYVLRGPDLEKLAAYSKALAARLRAFPGVVDADTTLVLGRPSYAVRFDRARAADLGVTAVQAAAAARAAVGGVRVGSFTQAGENYDVYVRAMESFRNDPNAIATLQISAANGHVVRLGDVANVVPSTGPASIERLSRQRQVTVYANVTPGVSEAAVIQALERARADLHMDPNYHASLTGRARELGRAGQSFATAFLLSLTFMYLVLAAQFESWIHPITILVALPLTVPFALLSLVLLGQSMNIFSTLGILVLFGIVKKNGILQVAHTRDLQSRGLSRPDAVMLGNRDRLRPILMTTLAFVAGMIPLVVSSGAGSGTNRAMGSVIIGGQLLSLLLTLIATPVVYTWFDDLSRWMARRFRRRPAQMQVPAREG